MDGNVTYSDEMGKQGEEMLKRKREKTSEGSPSTPTTTSDCNQSPDVYSSTDTGEMVTTSMSRVSSGEDDVQEGERKDVKDNKTTNNNNKKKRSQHTKKPVYQEQNNSKSVDVDEENVSIYMFHSQLCQFFRHKNIYIYTPNTH